MAGAPPENDAARCMKCGFCMATCPVYRINHKESHVARGRNVLIREVANGRKLPDGEFREALSQCLLCKRCEAVCLARVPSAEINLSARQALIEKYGRSFSQKLIHRLILKHRSAVARLIGLSTILPGLRLKGKGAKPLRHLADLALALSRRVPFSRMPASFLRNRIPYRSLSAGGKPRRGRVAFFPGCNYEFFFSDVGVDVVGALTNAGYEVIFPPGQTCCGMAVYNTGDRETARRMAEYNLQVLSGYDHVITACATCGTALKGYGDWFGEDHPLSQRAKEVSKTVSDFSEFMAREEQVGLRAPSGISVVTYHDPCHLRWHQGVYDAPRKILGSVHGLRFVEMDMAEKCCGQGGSFGIKHPQASLTLLAQKMESVRRTGAQAIVTSCPGCTVQLLDGVRRHGLSVDVLHISRLFRKDNA